MEMGASAPQQVGRNAIMWHLKWCLFWNSTEKEIIGTVLCTHIVWHFLRLLGHQESFMLSFLNSLYYILYPALSDLVMNRDEYRTEEHTVLLYTHFLSS